jgi:hypothetical protein
MHRMNRSRWFGLSTVVACLAVPAISAAQQQYETPMLGASAGVFMPADSKLRDALGGSWFTFGPGTVNPGSYRNRMLGFNYNVISNSRDGNNVFILTGTYGLTQPIGEQMNGAARPYFAIRGGIAYMDYSLDIDNDHISSKRIGFNANAEVGIMLIDRVTLSARYDVFGAADGFSFNGLSLELKYGLVRF